MKREGVVFLGDGSFSLIRDIKLMREIMREYPSALHFDKMIKKSLGVTKLPPLVGLILGSNIMLMVTSADLL